MIFDKDYKYIMRAKNPLLTDSSDITVYYSNEFNSWRRDRTVPTNVGGADTMVVGTISEDYLNNILGSHYSVSSMSPTKKRFNYIPKQARSGLKDEIDKDQVEVKVQQKDCQQHDTINHNYSFGTDLSDAIKKTGRYVKFEEPIDYININIVIKSDENIPENEIRFGDVVLKNIDTSSGAKCDCGEDKHHFGYHIKGCPKYED